VDGRKQRLCAVLASWQHHLCNAFALTRNREHRCGTAPCRTRLDDRAPRAPTPPTSGNDDTHVDTDEARLIGITAARKSAVPVRTAHGLTLAKLFVDQALPAGVRATSFHRGAA
jgi:hypothetical protein